MSERYALAIDGGTSFVEVALVDIDRRRVVGDARVPNGQVFFGTNVLARLSAALSGSVTELQCAVHESVLTAVEQMARGSIEDVLASVERIVVAANSVMAPLFCAIVPEGLVAAPFEPSREAWCHTGPLIEAWRDARSDTTLKAEMLAPLAAFVGGDARAVLVATGLNTAPTAVPVSDPTDDDASSAFDGAPHLIVDLGTNAEIMLRNGDQLSVASVPAGPTFEGMLGAGGAGLRGSDIIAMLDERLRSHAIDTTGLVVDPQRALPLTQEDVRDFQLAKAAVRVGIDLLLEEASVSPDEVGTFTLVGAFGSALDVTAATGLGMFDPALPSPTVFTEMQALDRSVERESDATLNDSPDRIATMDQSEGLRNAALAGAVRVALGESAEVSGTVVPLELASEASFADAFLDALTLGVETVV